MYFGLPCRPSRPWGKFDCNPNFRIGLTYKALNCVWITQLTNIWSKKVTPLTQNCMFWCIFQNFSHFSLSRSLSLSLSLSVSLYFVSYYLRLWLFSHLLHLHEIVEGLYFHFSLSVCLSVCVTDFSCEQNSSRTDTLIDAVFAKRLLSTLAQTLLKLVTLTKAEGHRRRSNVTWKKIVISRKVINPYTSYLVPRYNTISNI